jgi:dipeptidyl aminopeptidase/acylaminoacyl peptidase
MISAGLFMALAETAREAEATFPGENGRIASNRTTGEGVNNPEGDFEIFTMNQDGTGLTQLTENAAFDSNPEWSPDGGRIAFESDRDLFSDIFVMDSDGSGQTNVTNNRAFDRSATFAPDGERIIFDSNLSAGVDNPTGDTGGLLGKPRRHGPGSAHEQHGQGLPSGLRAGRQNDSLRERPELRAGYLHHERRRL